MFIFFAILLNFMPPCGGGIAFNFQAGILAIGGFHHQHRAAGDTKRKSLYVRLT